MRKQTVILSIILFSLLFSMIHVVFASSLTVLVSSNGDKIQLNKYPSAWLNFECVRTDDSETSYVFGFSDDLIHEDLYTIESTASIPVGSSITRVDVYYKIRSINLNNPATFETHLKHGGIDYSSDSDEPTTTYTLISHSFFGVIYSELSTMQIGVSITSGYKSGVYYTGRCTYIYAVIYYEQPKWNTIALWYDYLNTRSFRQITTWDNALISTVGFTWNIISSWISSLNTRTFNPISSWNNFLNTRNWNTILSWNSFPNTFKWNIIADWSNKFATPIWHILISWNNELWLVPKDVALDLNIDISFIVLIILLIISLALCVFRIPIVAFVFNLFGILLSAVSFTDTAIPYQFTLLVLVTCAISLYLNADRFMELGQKGRRPRIKRRR